MDSISSDRYSFDRATSTIDRGHLYPNRAHLRLTSVMADVGALAGRYSHKLAVTHDDSRSAVDGLALIQDELTYHIVSVCCENSTF